MRTIGSPAGMTYLGPVTVMKSVETQTDHVFGIDGLVSVPFSLLKKLLIEERNDKNMSPATPSIIKETPNAPPTSRNQQVESYTENQVTDSNLSRFDKHSVHTSSMKRNGTSIKDIGSSSKGPSKVTPSLSVKVKDVVSHSSTQSMDPNGMCKVCGGGRESKHVHYGGKSCHSCRAFFRRMAKTFAK